METVTEYKERPLARKQDEDCKPMTLLVRKYYHNKKAYYERNKEKLKAAARERYATDPVYKEMCCKRRVKRFERVNALKEFEGEDADK
jgi:ribosomal protein L20A (L18A)